MHKAGENAAVTTLEFKLLLTFAKNRGRVLSREQVIDLAWGRDTFVTDRAVDAHIVNLRRKLGQDLIASVRGMGYTSMVKISPIPHIRFIAGLHSPPSMERRRLV